MATSQSVNISATEEAGLAEIARRICNPNKCIVAADENVSTCGKIFSEMGVENTVDSRRRYRELIFSADESMNQHISGIVINDETARQSDSSGTPFITCLETKGILSGIKISEGIVHLANKHFKSKLFRLTRRLREFKTAGVKFAVWGVSLPITKSTPSYLDILDNANRLAKFATIAQNAGLVPILDVKLLPKGKCELSLTKQVMIKYLAATFNSLANRGVCLDGIVLKLSPVVPGTNYKGPKYSPDDMAVATILALKNTVPQAVGGLIFMSSGGRSGSVTNSLKAILNVQTPWNVSFIHGQGLLANAQHIWNGDDASIEQAQDALIKRLRAITERHDDSALLSRTFTTPQTYGAARTFKRAFLQAKDTAVIKAKQYYNSKLLEISSNFFKETMSKAGKYCEKALLKKAAGWVIEETLTVVGPITMAILAVITLTVKNKIFSEFSAVIQHKINNSDHEDDDEDHYDHAEDIDVDGNFDDNDNDDDMR